MMDHHNFSTIDYDSRLMFDAMNGAPLYSSDIDYSYDAKPQMRRSASSNSVFVAPGLMPSTDHDSSRSASSSTVGSPYSGHVHMASQQENFNAYAMHGLGVTPAIVGQDGFQQDYNHLPESEILGWTSFAESQKINGIGRSADLSYTQHRSSNVRLPISQSSSSPLVASFCSPSTSPDRISLTTVPDRAPGASPPAAAPVRASRSPHSVHESVFKSPSTPASAYPRTPANAISPVESRQQVPARQTSQMSQIPTSAPAGLFQTHFFAQSSGSFMPPIESSYPTLINPASYPEDSIFGMQNAFSHGSPAPSPAISPNHMAYNPHFSQPASPAPSHNQWVYAPQFQQPMNTTSFIDQQYTMGRRSSLHSFSSGPSHPSPSSEMNEEGEKGRCPFPDCGKAFKDLKAHMLTHQAERPEKCPITSCEYHLKGFARKYDKNRHTLTHYKGTMVCGFCPDTGTSAEKTFNRADVFKRHLTSVHHVEQTPPNSRKRSPGAANKKSDGYQQDAVTGKCSTCQVIFPSPQDFYEHLDDCVLRMVQQVEPSEDINAQHLSTISNDKEVQETFDRHMMKMEDNPTSFDEDDEEEDDDEDDEDSSYLGRSAKAGLRGSKPGNRVVLNGAITKKGTKKGLTWSQGGVALVGKGRKKRKDYPPAWGMHADKMRMKKRVTCVYDGQRRLAKDELMLNNEFEVRLPLPGGQGYVTDLDVETMKRAEGFLNASDAEKGPWNFQDMSQQEVDLQALMS